MDERPSSAGDESEPAIIVTRQQTRFQVDELGSNPGEIDVNGVTISLASSRSARSGTKGAKTVAVGKEILSNTHLKLKAGVRYCLIGRNGTGKSSQIFHIFLSRQKFLAPFPALVSLSRMLIALFDLSSAIGHP
ncbi:MAG: hypothetical protein L6R40_005037 [Gallowayella cf. fulva]|nr:MAG: hypothetical protein L6R40_005037 [Xanthomendoza cf. fulva]